MNDWLLMLAAGALTFGIRISFLTIVDHGALPAWLRDGLRLVTPSALAAIILPAVLYTGDPARFDASAANERLWAAIIAGAVAWLTRNVWATIGVGMGALWVLQAVM